MQKPFLDVHTNVFSGVRGLKFGLSHPLLPYLVYTRNREAKALARLRVCAGSFEPSLLAFAIRTKGMMNN